jgi:hypothetical protein
MQIETVGKFQLRLSAQQMADSHWDPFVAVLRFDDEKQDFVPVLDKRKAGEPCRTYEQAIEAARRSGTDFVRSAT